MTAALDELDKDGDSGVENPGAKDNILVLAIVDDIEENHHNMHQILELFGSTTPPLTFCIFSFLKIPLLKVL